MGDVFVMEKKNVNRKDLITKDGLHIIIGVNMERNAQVYLRELVLEQIEDLWGDMGIQNSWEEVIDEGICKGCVNWQMYGSRKPNSESYLLSNLFILKYRDTWELVDKNVKEFDLKKNIKKLSARYREWEDFEYKENIKEKLNKIQIKKKKTIKIIDQKKPKIENYGQIKNMEMLDNIMILPISYWGHGSYQKWIKVGWALANTNGKS